VIARRYDLEAQEDPEAAAEDYMWGLLRGRYEASEVDSRGSTR
jgi:hypothetical protein